MDILLLADGEVTGVAFLGNLNCQSFGFNQFGVYILVVSL